MVAGAGDDRYDDEQVSRPAPSCVAASRIRRDRGPEGRRSDRWSGSRWPIIVARYFLGFLAFLGFLTFLAFGFALLAAACCASGAGPAVLRGPVRRVTAGTATAAF